MLKQLDHYSFFFGMIIIPGCMVMPVDPDKPAKRFYCLVEIGFTYCVPDNDIAVLIPECSVGLVKLRFLFAFINDGHFSCQRPAGNNRTGGSGAYK
jgi:hypothetical protein